MFVILNWRGLLIIPRNDFAPSETLGTLTDSTGANYSTSICTLASRHLGLLPCRRCGINTLLFRRKGFSRPVMYYSNSNAIFQPELLIISGDVNVNPGPVSKRNQALGQLLQHVHRDTQRQFSENICSEDDLRPRIFGAFVVKFLACVPPLGFSNI